MISDYRKIRPKVIACVDINKQDSSAFGVKYEFFNNTGKTVDVTGIYGLTTTIQPTYARDDQYNQMFVVRQTLTATHDQLELFRRQLNDFKAPDAPIANTYRGLVNTQVRGYQFRQLVVEYLVHVTEFEGIDTPLLVDGTEFMLRLSTGFTDQVHPNSENGQLLRAKQEMRAQQPTDEVAPESGVDCAVQVVDNEDRIGDRFVNVLNRTIKVRPIKRHGDRSGAYITVTKPTGRDPRGNSTETYFLDIGELTPENGFYLTQEAARSMGDAKLLQAMVENENLKLKTETNRLNQEKERENITHGREKIRHERSTLKSQTTMSEQKAWYERSELKTRFFIDILKSMTAILTLMFGLRKIAKV